MKKIIKYKADDGREFLNEDECMEYETQERFIKSIISVLPEPPDDCGFSNGEGYIQHEPVIVNAVKTQLLREALRHSDHKWLQESIDKDDIHPSWAARIMGDCVKSNALNRAWYRIQCIDNRYREWGQPYYANHPGEAKQICLNG